MKQSAGLLLYRKQHDNIEVLLGHAGGPFFAKKDRGAWSIPKGEFADGEDPLQAAYREYAEEIGSQPPTGEPIALGSVKRSDGKQVYIWAIEGDLDAGAITSNTFELEWPPKSGQIQEFPEFDRAAWFAFGKAAAYMPKYQLPLLDRLAAHIGVAADPPEESSAQTSLF